MNKTLIAASLFAAFVSLSLAAPSKADIANCVEEVTVVENEIGGATPGDLKEKAWQKHSAAGTAIVAKNEELCFSLLNDARLALNDGQGRSE